MIVGLTGGIGSGKSTVARFFELLGYPVFNSDKVAKEVYFKPEIKEKIIQLLGPEVYTKENTLNKNFISSKIFANTDLLHSLNTIIHPAVKKEFISFVSSSKNKLIIKESALLFEARLEKEVNKIILVVADDDLRLKRVIKRDGLMPEEVLKKIKSQLPQSEKMKKSDFVINNNEKELVIPQINAILNKLI